MILLREVQERDVDALERLGQVPGMMNLAGDRDVIRERVARAQASFADSIDNKCDAKYIFVAEDLSTGRVVGTSMVAAQHGTVESPHFYFEVGSEEKFSETISTGFIHGTLKLKYDTNGPSELGGLVLDAEARGNTEARIGRQISFVRFLFIGLHKGRFKKKLIAELLPPLNKKGQSPLWEAVGRRFTNMDYWEADQLCQKSKEFIFSLFPSGKIYTTFLPAEARNAIGKVGKDTEPVMHMLKKIGFTYRNQVDPFDGGPHFWAGVDEVLPIRKLSTPVLSDRTQSLSAHAQPDSGLISRPSSAGDAFRALDAQAVLEADGSLTVLRPSLADLRAHLGMEAGQTVAFMPYY